MDIATSEDRLSKLSGLLLVIAIHGALLYVAMSYKLIPPPSEAITLMVNLINPLPKKEEPPPPEPPKPPPKKVTLVKERPIVRPQPAPVLVAEAPVTQAAEPVAPPPEPVKEAPPAPEPIEASAAPAQLSALSLACPQRSQPDYPAVSRRKGEQGQVRLRVELDETGQITSVKVATSSGYARLDNAGIAAVKTWHCEAAMRDGKPVRAVAMQPFDFILE